MRKALHLAGPWLKANSFRCQPLPWVCNRRNQHSRKLSNAVAEELREASFATSGHSSSAARLRVLGAADPLSHGDFSGKAAMVGGSGKAETSRMAVASAKVMQGTKAFSPVADNQIEGQDAVYTGVKSPLHLSAADINKYYTLSANDQDLYFGEGLPSGLLKEFEASKGSSVLVRTRFLELCNRLQREVEDTIPFELPGSKPMPVLPQKHYLLDGPVGSGKSVILAMLVHWARNKGWLVFYVPNGRDWTQHEYYFQNENTGRWDTPIQAKAALEGFLKSHVAILSRLPCRIFSPLALGEGAGHLRARGTQELQLAEGSSLKDLVEKGVSVSQASVSALVRLREELELVEDVPVLYAIDEYNSWFTLSRYFEATGERASRQIHADELTMVHAFRTMETSHLMVAAFSHSTGVGKLPLHLPGLPKKTRFDTPRYNPEEAMATFHYYRRQNVLKKDPVPSNVKRLFFLTNGNAAEMRKFACLV